MPFGGGIASFSPSHLLVKIETIGMYQKAGWLKSGTNHFLDEGVVELQGEFVRGKRVELNGVVHGVEQVCVQGLLVYPSAMEVRP